ncbi:MAG: stage II sporulation protein D [Desulfitobacterium sp.]|nr:stage II sporulation protein D [Desulfitobacterium sp.]
MRRNWFFFLILLAIMIILFPWTVLRWVDQDIEIGEEFTIRVLLEDGTVETLGLEEYIIGVVAAEMPAEFAEEALKAQAVAARTYAAKRINENINSNYDVDTTTNTQVWLSAKEMRDKWNWLSYWRYYGKISRAVESTRNQVLIANGQYVDAFFHSSTGRKPTERSEDVWSSSRPYLQNIESGEENPNRFVKTTTLTPGELYKKLGIPDPPKAFSKNDFQILSETATGRVKAIKVLGKSYTGSQLRTLLDLSSTDMEIDLTPQEVKITTYGYGHGVGMSQYGANDLANKGYNHEEILQHYYPGTSILTLKRS